MTARKIYTFRLNDATPDDHPGRVINGSSMQYLTAGDTIALFFRQVSGNVVDIGSSSRLTIHRVSIG